LGEYKILLVLGAGCIALGFLLHWLYLLARVSLARRDAGKIIQEARKEAEAITKEARLQAKEELFRLKEALEKENEEVRLELRNLERRLSRREDNLDTKVDILNKKERLLESAQEKLAADRKRLEAEKNELDTVLARQKEELLRIGRLTEPEARRLCLERIEAELEDEAAEIIRKKVEKIGEIAEQKAREIIGGAIQRFAANHTVESVVSSVDVPNDEMKGRIIGREGRNIRAFEKATGIDVIVDDTPGVIVLSGFDSVRREMARRAMEKLILDGRIHPSRIEEVVAQTKQEMEQLIIEEGKQVAYEMDIHNLHPKEIALLGRLKFRTSFGQNVLQHSKEVAYLASMMAGELGLDVQLAKRCGLLHDIGKAVDHEMEGGHPQIGADIARRFSEPPEVINSILAHHEGAEPTSIYTVLVAAADAISASRPGARRETFEKYIKRLERLEQVAGSFSGVEQAYAVQAGREVRVIVNADKVTDKEAAKICHDIAKEIEAELQYPGEVKVTLIRETRVVEYAH